MQTIYMQEDRDFMDFLDDETKMKSQQIKNKEDGSETRMFIKTEDQFDDGSETRF